MYLQLERFRIVFSRVLLAGALLWSSMAFADGLAIGKIYDPYVQPLERELEYQFLLEDRNDTQLHKFGYGQSVSSQLFVEGYGLFSQSPRDSFDLEGFELEAKWQLTEQGEYASDWAVMMELEREFDANAWEMAATVINSIELNQWQATINASLVAEWGSGVKDELETELKAQLKYRLARHFEPGLELFAAQETHALGPVIMGSQRLGGKKSLFWQAGVYLALDDDTPDNTVRLNLEYEF